MFPRSWFLVVVLVVLFACSASSCRRRRSPPPAVNCRVSSWSSWSACSKKCEIGSRTRNRRITTSSAHGGARCPTLSGMDGCGQVNGGCGDSCIENDGTCVCTSNPGYELQGDRKSCADKNECSDGSAACINSNCRNTDGSYVCDCFSGYQHSSSMNPRHCERKLCAPLTAPQCPAGAYRDEFGTTCTPATVNCPNGHQYQRSCTLTCADSYKLAVIAQPNFGQTFAENFTTVDFDSPSDRTVCTLDSNTVSWDWNPGTTPYYCRRLNDPPLDVTISNTVINEKESVLTPVGKLSATDPQKDRLIFGISNLEGNVYFLIQGNMLLVKTRLVWTPNLGNNTYSVVVNVSDNGSPMMHSTATFHIGVLNINDPPYRLELSNNEISENVPINYIVGNLTAIDDDVDPRRTSHFFWEIVDSDNGFFSLSGNEILVAKSLDHESKNIHKIQVRCTDYGNPRKSSQVVSMFISVRDSNDSPKHINLTNHRVSENSPVGTLVGEIIATDEDNDTLSFDLQGTDSRVLDKFELEGSGTCALHLKNGIPTQTCSVPLVVKGSLDYEMENEYIIWVGVTDPGGVTHKQFRIEVENVNERPTDILISDDRVPENSPGGTVVGEFLVQDPDNKNGLTQIHTCSLVNSRNGDEDAFYIAQIDHRNLLRIKANKILDFETKKVYNITVFCKDTNLGISKLLLIEVTDVNERPTSLVLSSTSVKESESSMIYIGTLSATDPEGINQTFIYTVRDSQSFRIGGTNKDQLFFLGPLDFEHTPSVSVHVRVTDNGELYLEKIFTITVQDVNDPPTDIRLQPADAKLSEDSGENVFISQVEMIDQDSNTRASCRLLNSSNDRVKLISMILVVGPTITDYESLDSSKSLQILVTCEDQYGASVARWINLPVEDVNEAPTRLTLSKLEIRENRNDTLVGILEITDPDVGQRHRCTILDVDTPFYIDSSTNPPTLKTARPLDFESSRVEYVDINCEDIVLDHRQAQHFIEEQFKINVIDVNEAPQIFCNTPFFASPSFSRGSVLGQIQSYDPDNERYHMSKKQNPNGPFELRKQLLSIRFENENISWPFYFTQNEIIHLKKQPTAEEYNSLITFRIRVDDDGTVLERKNGPEGYRIKKDETKYSVHNCSVLIGSNETEIDFRLSSNIVPENSTYGTIIIGYLSRTPLLDDEQISYHILEVTNRTQPFEIDRNILKVKLDSTLDYERLPADKSLPITISSVASISGVFTKQFLIKVLDVNEMPTAICLTSPRPLDDCSVVGHFLIEDLDYPELQCGISETIDLEKFSSQLSEYTCHIQEGVDTLSNKVFVNEYFYIQDSPPSLFVKKTVFTHGDASYDIPIVCRSTIHPLHIIRTTLNVNITVPDDPDCRRGELCASCSSSKYCLSHVAAASKCVGEDYRIKSTVAKPVSVFEKPGYISIFEDYVTSLIEGTAQGKTLAQLDNQNGASRRRREAQYSDVYVELLVYVGQGTSTNVVFAVAEKSSYNLIPASAACELLKNTEVKCLADDTNTSPGKGDDTNTSADKGDETGESGFPLWIIYIVVGVILVVFIITLVVIRRKAKKRRDNNSTSAHYNRNNNAVTLGSNSVYEIPFQDRDQSYYSHSGTSKPFVVEKQKVCLDPAFAKPGYCADKDWKRGGPSTSRQSTMNHYEANPYPVYESIDGDLHARVHDAQFGRNGYETGE